MPRSIHFVMLMAALHLAVLPAFAQPPAHLAGKNGTFGKYCKSCHNWEKGDDYEVFDKDGMPFPAKMNQVIARMSSVEDNDDHMPPKGSRQPTADELAAVRAWAGGAAGANPAPGGPDSAPKTCEILAQAPAPEEGRGVTDAHAAKIFGKSCALCHSTDFGKEEKAAMTGGLLALMAVAAGTFDRYRRARNNVEPYGPNAGPKDRCGRLLGALGNPLVRASLVLTALGSSSVVAGLKLPHTQFLNRDPGHGGALLDPHAMANKDEILEMIVSMTAGAGGRSSMPPRAMPPAANGHYSPEDKRALLTWMHQLGEKDLPPKCQAFVTGSGSYNAISDQCSGSGMRIPSADQMTQLASQLQGGLKESCYWTSGFSEDGKSPRLAWADGKIASVGSNASCGAVCLR